MNKALLKFAGKQAIRGNFGASVSAFADSFKSEVPLLNSATYSRQTLFDVVKGSPGQYFKYSGIGSCLTAYQRCAPVAAIINRKAIADANGKFGILNSKGKAEGKEATGEIAKKIAALLNRPNPMESGYEFFLKVKIYTQLYGHCIIMPTGVPIGFAPYEAKYWWVVPPTMYEIEEKSDFNYDGSSIKTIRISAGSKARDINPDQVLLIKDVTPSNQVFGMPTTRLEPNAEIISNIIGAYESRGVLIDQRGPSIVVSSAKGNEEGDIPLTPAEQKQLEDGFAARYGLRSGQTRAIITNAAINVTAVGYSTKDLMLFEEIKDDIERLCDAFVFPSEAMASAKGSTFANGYNADKVLYQNAIIPESEVLLMQLSAWLKCAENGIELQKDFSHVAALQENRKEQGEARRALNQALQMEFRSNIISINRYRELLGEPKVEGQDNVYYSDIKELIGAAAIDLQNNQDNGNQQTQNGGSAN